ncbi:hypothetical protein N0V85_009770, partial [Neurospora sp. IMI 360204]
PTRCVSFTTSTSPSAATRTHSLCRAPTGRREPIRARTVTRGRSPSRTASATSASRPRETMIVTPWWSRRSRSSRSNRSSRSRRS